MRTRIFIFCFLLVTGVVPARGESEIKKIDKLIATTPKIAVLNPSSLDGDIITPRHSVGYSGSGSSRKELFEEKRKLMAKTRVKAQHFTKSRLFWVIVNC
jgi:hypothetical protein